MWFDQQPRQSITATAPTRTGFAPPRTTHPRFTVSGFPPLPFVICALPYAFALSSPSHVVQSPLKAIDVRRLPLLSKATPVTEPDHHTLPPKPVIAIPSPTSISPASSNPPKNAGSGGKWAFFTKIFFTQLKKQQFLGRAAGAFSGAPSHFTIETCVCALTLT